MGLLRTPKKAPLKISTNALRSPANLYATVRDTELEQKDLNTRYHCHTSS